MSSDGGGGALSSDGSFGLQIVRLPNPMAFPNSQQLIEHYGNNLIFGPIMIGIGVYLLFRLLKWRQGVDPTPHPLQLALTPIVVIIACIYLSEGAPLIISDLLFRFDLTQVSEIEVEFLSKNKTCQPLVINNEEIIKTGFIQLENARYIKLVRAGFIDDEAYRIRLKRTNSWPHYSYLYVFRSSTAGKPVKGILPSNQSSESYQTWAYVSSEFYDWVNTYIEPHFRDCLS